MSSHSKFELNRLSDGLTYRFNRMVREGGSIGYKREDQDVWIVHSPRFGWIAMDQATGEIMGRPPWNTLPEEQSDYPPEGEWVSKKGAKSYVYELRYIE